MESIYDNLSQIIGTGATAGVSNWVNNLLPASAGMGTPAALAAAAVPAQSSSMTWIIAAAVVGGILLLSLKLRK